MPIRIDLALVMIVVAGACLGCGNKTPSQPDAAAGTPPAQSTGPEVTAESAAQTADPKSKETQWIGNIPYDVFYDQPLTIAADSTSLAPAPAVATTNTAPNSAPKEATEAMVPMPELTADAPAATEAPVTSGASNWGAIIPMAMLVEEVKSLRTSLTGNLQTVATYNKSQVPIATDGSTLAAMAAIAIVHPEAVSWKANAKYIRDLASQVNANSAGNGREPYGKTKDPFDKLLVVLDGGKPPEMESTEVVPYSEVVYVSDMMKRIESSFNNLKANINTESRLKENPAATEKELRVLYALAALMSDKSYDNADEEKYQAFLSRFQGGAQTSLNALHAGDLDGFQSGLNQIQTTCAECHVEYRGSEAGF
ncbi:hypothetical protein SH668x_000225 [Planctomicrobium sp. SH668]|uniref:hypothetical protein n=1 Tax=Planctomicrobium sp. SH668 TaxID=3448126 RepID=UPI003F5CBA0D